MIATSRFLTALECIKCKFVFGQTPSWFKGDPTSEGNKKEDSGGERKERKMHQIRFRLGLRPTPLRELSTLPQTPWMV